MKRYQFEEELRRISALRIWRWTGHNFPYGLLAWWSRPDFELLMLKERQAPVAAFSGHVGDPFWASSRFSAL